MHAQLGWWAESQLWATLKQLHHQMGLKWAQKIAVDVRHVCTEFGIDQGMLWCQISKIMFELFVVFGTFQG